MDAEDGEPLGDGSHLVYANASYVGEGPLADLLHDFREPDPSKMRDPMLRERLEYLKNTEKGRREMSSTIERIMAMGREEGLEEGRKEGREEGRKGVLEAVSSLVSAGELSAKAAARAFRLTDGELAALA